MIRLAVLLACTACLFAADQVLFDAGAAGALKQVTANEPDKASLVDISAAGEHGAAVVRVACQATDSYPGIAIHPGKPWNLASHAWIEVRLGNPSDHAIAVVLRVDNAGDWKSNPWNGETLSLAPGATGTLRVWFGRSWGQPGFKLDPAAVSQVLVFLSKPKTAGTFTVRSIVAGGKPGEQP